MEHLLSWLGFSLTKGVGSTRLQLLVNRFGSVEAAWRAPETDLQAAHVLDSRTLNNLFTIRRQYDLAQEYAHLQQLGISLVPLGNDNYPPLLKYIIDPPILLYVRGQLPPIDAICIGVVGTRQATQYGKSVAQALVEGLARAGVTIISGLAIGIDATAHQAALQGGGQTVAVMPCGLDKVYPAENHALAKAIVEHGALISEYPLGSIAERRHFPPRNRIISGMSLGVLIVEAGEKSGALITADTALEQGREVYAVPGNVLSSTSKGTNALLQSGAKMVTTVQDILDDLNMLYLPNAKRLATVTHPANPTENTLPISPVPKEPSSTPSPAPSVPRYVPPPPPLDDPLQQAIVEMLRHGPQHLEDIAMILHMPVHIVGQALTVLELNGHIIEVNVREYTATN